MNSTTHRPIGVSFQSHIRVILGRQGRCHFWYPTMCPWRLWIIFLSRCQVSTSSEEELHFLPRMGSQRFGLQEWTTSWKKRKNSTIKEGSSQFWEHPWEWSLWWFLWQVTINRWYLATTMTMKLITQSKKPVNFQSLNSGVKLIAIWWTRPFRMGIFITHISVGSTQPSWQMIQSFKRKALSLVQVYLKMKRNLSRWLSTRVTLSSPFNGTLRKPSLSGLAQLGFPEIQKPLNLLQNWSWLLLTRWEG